jgi:hypothetical protein
MFVMSLAQSKKQEPRFEVEERHIGLPDEETMSCEDGLYQNHFYRDLRWIDEGDFKQWWDAEQRLLEYKGDLMSDEAMYELEDNEVYCNDIDAGVASTVAALAVIGACPVTSCSGPKPEHYEEYPLVLCWCTADQLELIRRAAALTGVDVVGACEPGVLICTPDCLDVEPMRAFALQLVALHREQ